MKSVNWGVVLGGGNAYGATQPPILKNLTLNRGWAKKGSGTSVGVVNGVIYAGRQIGVLDNEWLRLNYTSDFARKNWWWFGVRDLEPLRKRLVINNIGASCHMEFWAGMYDYENSEYMSVAMHEIQDQAEFHQGVIAAATQPFPVMVPIKFRGRWVTDAGAGGHVLPPLGNYDGLTELHVISCTPLGPARKRKYAHEEIKSPLKQTQLAINALLDRQIAEDIEEHIDTTYDLGMDIYIYAPQSWDVIGDAFEASPQIIRQRMAEGYRMYENPYLVIRRR